MRKIFVIAFLLLQLEPLFAQDKYDIFKKGTVLDVLTLIKENNSILHELDSLGRTPLIIAIESNNNEDVAIELIKSGSDINFRDTINQLSALHETISKDKKETFLFLIDQPQIELNIQSKNGLTPLFYAIYQKKNFFANKLLDYRADINKSTFEPYSLTPIFAAVSRETDTLLIKRLIHLGADLTHKTRELYNPLEYAFCIDSIHRNIILLLISTYKTNNIPLGNYYELLEKSILRFNDAKILSSLLYNSKQLIDSLNNQEKDKLLLFAYKQKKSDYFKTLVHYGLKPDFKNWKYKDENEKNTINDLIINASR